MLQIQRILNMIKLLRKSLHRQLSTKKINKPIVDYNQRGQYRTPLNLKVGDTIHQFEVTHTFKFPDFQIDAAALKCRKYGTQWVHFDCQQQTNSLGLVIKCKQTPHIMKLCLQKLLQCGSKKYPVRNPVQFMCRRSFNPQNFGYVTNDYIFYAYQTMLLHDHKNLMDVFLQMMYNPLMREEDFREAVWRYALRDSRKLEITGDIVSQLKAMESFSHNKIFNIIQSQLLKRPGFGKSEQITNITYNSVVEWYHKTFTPNNLLVISHGDLHPARLIQNYRKITQQFKWSQKKVEQKQMKNQQIGSGASLQQSKTIKIEHLQPTVPLVLSFKIENISSTDRILLSILSYILFDMPDAFFLKWNSPQTPYPKHYGFQGNYFNLGITFLQTQKPIEQKQFLEQQKQIRAGLLQLYTNKIPSSLIQQCLYHLQTQYHSSDGIKIINGCLDNLLQLGPSSLEESLNVKAFISKTLRNYRKQNIFQNLLKKYLIDNQKYIRIWGKMNADLIQDAQFSQSVKLNLLHQNMKENELQQIKKYVPPNILQDYKILPQIDINQLQIFEQKNPTIFTINQIPVYHTHKCDGIKLSIKYDITDIQEDQVKLLPILCYSYPFMGAKGINSQAFNDHVSMYIKKIWMNFETCRTNEGMKIFLFLNLQFSQRNAEYGFNLCSNLINDHYDQNLSVLSKRIQRKGSQIYNQMTQNLAEIHGRHIAGTRSPYALIQDPIFMARSTCGIASDILKVSNPRQMLNQIAHEIKNITKKFQDKNRMSILFQCKRGKVDKYRKYLQMMVRQKKMSNSKLEVINDKDFTPQPCMKYFPNYNQQFVFQAFSVPYYKDNNQVPVTLVLSTIINQNIKRYNQFGGCFLFKGSLVSYIRGSRKKVLQLQDYYKNIQDLSEAKRFIFQKFRRYTASDLFYTGVTAQETRIFKQAVAMVQQQNVKACLQKYILSVIKEEKSSILCLGPHLGSYEPMIKKGWVVQRSVQGMSLKMQSQYSSIPKIQMSKYINIY